MPNIKPVSIELKVNPGKYAPGLGKEKKPITSPTNPISIAGKGPNSHPAIASGMNVKVMRRLSDSGNFTAYSATKRADNIPQFILITTEVLGYRLPEKTDSPYIIKGDFVDDAFIVDYVRVFDIVE